MEKRRKIQEAKRFIAPTVPRKPKTMPLHELARKTASIRQNNVARHKAHVERLSLQEGIKRAQLLQNMKMERDALLGVSLHGHLRAGAHNRLEELTTFLRPK